MNDALKAKTVKAIVSIFACAIVAAGALLAARYQHTSPTRLPDRCKTPLRRQYSSVDADGDGIDDASDILAGALDYVNTKPKYRSRYYESGYPDDGFGVCTDVVANALRSAGYDLMTLVAEDISRDPCEYGIEKPDRCIDFRRVRNLNVYFSHTAVSLTTDPYETDEWQGGDIVVFEGHIGVVSDRRNRRGVAYVIHHSGPFQARYEEDILEKRGDIIGHYRVSE